MINANELRIGNKLQKDNGQIYTVSRLDNTQDVLVIEQRGLLTLNYNIFGIPLTTEILEKCGFINNGHYYTLNNIISLLGVDKNGLNTTFILGDNITKPVIYLHQLQNLHFALTGEELNYQP